MKPQSKTDWDRVKRDAEADAPIPFDPAVDPYDPNDAAAVDAFWADATVTHAGKDESMQAVRRRVRGPQRAPRKVATAIRLSPEVVDYFKAAGPGWQSRLDDALREYVQTHKAA